MTEKKDPAAPQCFKRLEVHLTIDGKPMAQAFYCEHAIGHPGLHGSDMHGQERGRVWTDDGIDFFEGPYGTADNPDALACLDYFDAADGTHIGCVRPKGHTGSHGNYHGEDSPTYWTGYEALPAALSDQNFWGGPVPEGAKPSAHFEIVIANGIAVPKELRLNGMVLPNVRGLTVEYAKDDARTVLVEILATSITEVPQ